MKNNDDDDDDFSERQPVSWHWQQPADRCVAVSSELRQLLPWLVSASLDEAETPPGRKRPLQLQQNRVLTENVVTNDIRNTLTSLALYILKTYLPSMAFCDIILFVQMYRR